MGTGNTYNGIKHINITSSEMYKHYEVILLYALIKKVSRESPIVIQNQSNKEDL